MPASLQSPADITNAALGRIGYRLRVGSLFDGSVAAKKALDIYGQTRDELLRQNDWGFAQGDETLQLLKTAPAGGYVPPIVWSTTYPPLPWRYEYLYPSDALKVRSLKGSPILIPVYDPVPILYEVANDNSLDPPAKVILSNLTNAVLTYTRQVTNPASWEADFTESMIAALSRRLAPGLNPELLKIAVPDEAQSQAVAEMNQG